jgi:thioredoxin-like negative regulator of GroEL
VDGLEQQYGERLTFRRIDFDSPEGQRLARRFLVRAHPAVLVVGRDGQAAASFVGVPARADVEQAIRRAVP